jgi:hypothetical protein
MRKYPYTIFCALKRKGSKKMALGQPKLIAEQIDPYHRERELDEMLVQALAYADALPDGLVAIKISEALEQFRLRRMRRYGPRVI